MKRATAGITATVLAALVGLVPAGALGQCCGDCNDDGGVTVDEVLSVVNRALTGCSDDGICSTGGCPGELAACQSDLATCRAQAGGQLLASGQTTSYVLNDDGAIKAGAALSYTDNGDGTITDNNTGLMWEKKVMLDFTQNRDNPHDADNCYQWSGYCDDSDEECGTCLDCSICKNCSVSDATVYQWVAELNAANFAGHNDWRIPNVRELQSILDYGHFSPIVAPAFNGASCGTSCTDMTSPACSCTQGESYWSSTTSAYDAIDAWSVSFYDGSNLDDWKSNCNHVRAVRGGL
jgi:hypothetical protein